MGFVACAGLQAAPLVGQFGFTGAGVAVWRMGAENFIDFSTFNANDGGLGVGQFAVTTVSSGNFPYPNSAPGTIKDTSDTNPPTAPYSYLPVGVPVSLANYITITGFNHNFVAELLQTATCPYVPGTLLCAGPFTLVNNGGGVSIAATVRGRIIDNATLEESFFVLTLDGTVNNTTVEAVAAAAITSTGITLDNWSGTLNADAVPEPGTMALLGLAFVAFGLTRKFRS